MSIPEINAYMNAGAIDPALVEATHETVARTGHAVLSGADYSTIGEGCVLHFDWVARFEMVQTTLVHDIGHVGDHKDPALRRDLLAFANSIGAAFQLDTDGTARLLAGGWLEEPSEYYQLGQHLGEIDPDLEVRDASADVFRQYREDARAQREEVVSATVSEVQQNPLLFAAQTPGVLAEIEKVSREALERDWPLIEHAVRETDVPHEDWTARISARVLRGDHYSVKRLSTQCKDSAGQSLSAMLLDESLGRIVSPLSIESYFGFGRGDSGV